MIQPTTPAHGNRTGVVSRAFLSITGKQFVLHQLNTGRHVTRAKYHFRPAIRSLSRWYISAVKSVGIALFALKSITSSRMTSPSSYRITAETFQLRGFVQYFAHPFSCLTAPSMPDGRTVNAANG